METIDQGLCSRIRRAEQALMLHHESVLRAYGLTMTQYVVLLTLSHDGELSGTQLARACGVTPQTMTGVLQGLQGKELIERKQSEVHGKVQLSHLTSKGKRILSKAYKEVDVLEDALRETFTVDEYTKICDLLQRATETLANQTRR
jgi:DNA-binding MarR family transcriptional regulator